MEKLTRYRFEQKVQDVNENSRTWLKDEFKTILEANKSYQSKCDYIGYSILSIDEKISLLDEQINELSEYKAKLKTAKEIALTLGAEVFSEYGISKIEGAGISSITITPSSANKKLSLLAHNKDELINAGFYKKSLDEEAVLKAFSNNEYLELINKYATVIEATVNKPSKLKINKRRNSSSSIELDAKIA